MTRRISAEPDAPGREDGATPFRAFRWFRRARLWVVPASGVVLAVVLASITLILDRYVISTNQAFLPFFTGSEATARDILSLIAISIATLTALVFTVVAVVLQLASQQYSPRALRTFLQDIHSHVTIGTFVGTFTYVVMVLQALQVTIDDNTVTSASVTVGFVLAVFSLGTFVSYIDHIVHEARVTSIIDRIGTDTRRAIGSLHPATIDEETPFAEGTPPDGTPDRIVRAARPGVVLELDIDGLVTEAVRCGCVLVIVPAVGDFIPGDAPIVEVYGGDETDDVLRHIELDPERTITQDVAFGFRLLVDIAQRGLSPAINDPTTAVQAIDQMHDLLRRLARRHFPTGVHTDGDATPRLFMPVTTWENYVSIACDELRHYGQGSIQVARRMRAMLEDVRDIAPDDRRGPLDRQIDLLDALIERNFPDERDREAARIADRQGIGSGNATAA